MPPVPRRSPAEGCPAPPDLSDAADRVSPDGVRRRPNDERVPDPDDFVGDDCIDLTGDAFEPSD